MTLFYDGGGAPVIADGVFGRARRAGSAIIGRAGRHVFLQGRRIICITLEIPH